MKHTIALLEAAVSCGAPTRGTEQAYDALVGELSKIFPESVCYPMEKLVPCSSYPPHLLYLDTVMAVSRRLRETMLRVLELGAFPIVIGGDHSVAMGSLAALGEHFGAEEIALVYIDAHTDINTEQTSATHYIHGMDLAAACGLCCDELTVGERKANILGENIHIIGARSIDPPEYGIMAQLGVHCCSAEELRSRGVEAVLHELLTQLEGKRIHISFDTDFLDPAVFRATGYHDIPNGGTWQQVCTLVGGLLKSGGVCSLECVEYCPPLDEDGRDKAALCDFFRFVRDVLQG